MQKNEIYLIHGNDPRAMAEELMERTDVASMIGDKGSRIALKPNMVIAAPASSGATTHTEIVEGVITYLKNHGFQNIVIMEGSWAGEKTSMAIKRQGYDRLCRKYDVPFIDLQKEKASVYDAAGMKLHICDYAVREVDFMINLPVLKGHCQTNITCALKNMKGLLPNSEKRRFHTMGLHDPIAHLNTVVRGDYILVDNICGDLDFEEGGNPVQMNRLFACTDPVLCDAYVCECMGYLVDEVPYIRIAEQLGVGTADLSQAKIEAVNEAEADTESFPQSRRVKELARHVNAKNACSVCYGSLIYALHRLKENGMLPRVDRDGKIAIGQGFRGKAESGNICLGIGNCTSCMKKNLRGCPPSGGEILKYLEENYD